jgi:nucleoid-associated protein YgaU
MALDYELRSEFKNLPLETLMDHAVSCFQGVGDNQSELLEKYFGVHTIRDLANLPFFSMALEVQKAALEGNGARSSSVAALSQRRELGFAVRDKDQDMTVQELLDAPIQALEGLSPAQSLALYDAFRITNIRQLAHNRIMIESRIIQYLDHHGPEAADISGTPDEILAVLAGDRPDLPSQSGGRVDATDVREEEQELTEHVRGRLDALRERARVRAHAIPEEEGELSRADRIAAMRESRDRLEGARGQHQIGGYRGEGQEESRLSARDRVAALRAGGGAGGTSDALAAIREREASRRGVTSTTRSRIEALSAARSGAGGGAAAGAAAGARTSGNGSADTAGRSGSGSPRPSIAAQARQETTKPAAEETPAAAATRREPRERAPNYAPILVAAAVALIVVIGIIVWFNLSGDQPPPPVAQESATQGDQTASTATGDGATTGSAAAGGTSTTTAGDTGTATTASVTRQPPPPSGPIHVVQRGNSLWRISRMYYKNPLMWPEIFDANRDKIRDPDLIYPNQRFVIPER